MNSNEWLTPAQAVDYLGGHVKYRTLEAWRRTGLGPPFHKAGNRLVLYKKSDLDEWLEKNRIDPEATDETRPR